VVGNIEVGKVDLRVICEKECRLQQARTCAEIKSMLGAAHKPAEVIDINRGAAAKSKVKGIK